MQFDFHHAVTYVTARLAGFSHEDADVVAYCAQYVDDATNSGVIEFDNGALYSRLSSAHKALDYRNFKDLANHRVWLPFHFLPGNGGLPAGQDPAGGFIEKLICRPDSPVAHDMIASAIADRHKRYGLARLGIAMHVYADTWAHQGFAGVCHQINYITTLDHEGNPDATISSWFGDVLDRLKSEVVATAWPLGHGAALSNPDKPFLQWSYVDHRGEKILRDNPSDFVTAADHLCRAMRRYIAGDPNADLPGLPDADREKIAGLFLELEDPDSHVRWQGWAERIARGDFSFGPAEITFIDKGEGSWKHQALGTTAAVDDEGTVFPFTPEFLTSRWKQFHDAAEAHRSSVVRDILPHYGIVSA